MEVIYGLIPFVLLFGFLAVLVFIWMAKKGQFDDLDRAAHQIFLNEDDDPPAGRKKPDAASTTGREKNPPEGGQRT